MQVKFKRLFFAPNGVRYKSDRWYEVPESLREKLPKDAEIAEDPEPAKPVKAGVKK